MGVHRGIASSAGEVLIVSVFDMVSTLRVSISFGQSEIDNVDDVLFATDADQKVVRLDVSVDEVSRMHEFYSLEELFSQHQHSFQGKFPFAVVEQIFQRRPQ